MLYNIKVQTKHGNAQFFVADEALYRSFRCWLVGGHSGQEEESWGSLMSGLSTTRFSPTASTPVAEAFFFASGAVLRSNIDTVTWISVEEAEITKPSTQFGEQLIVN